LRWRKCVILLQVQESSAMHVGTPILPDRLAVTDLFANLPMAGLSDALEGAKIRHLEKGSTIFSQGARAERAHIVLEGRVRILQTDEDGAQVVVRFIGPGETFGTVALFTDHLYPAHAVAVTDCMEVSWPEATLLDLMARYPQIGLNLVKAISARLQEAQDRLREIATQRVERRIAHALLRLAAQAGRRGDNGTSIDFPLSRRDVAEMCGATLHTVSRTLTAWEKTGWLETRRQRLTIRDIAEIRKHAGQKI
jgi:CRP-like cAMP-binding protein